MEDYRKIAIELGQTLISKAPETRKDVERMLPELKESEDEKIRKALKQYFVNSFQDNGVAAICGVHIKDVLAWLEKKGEKKTEWSEEDEQRLEYVIREIRALRPKKQWKPTEEQIRVVARLRYCLLQDVRGNDIVILDNLLEQLKAL